jgi:hypothetical protein
MTTISGTFTNGVSNTFQPTANTVFSVTVGAAPTPNVPNGILTLQRSQDGTNFAPIVPNLAQPNLAQLTFQSPLTFDQVEQRSGTTYRLAIISGSSTLTYRVDY